MCTPILHYVTILKGGSQSNAHLVRTLCHVVRIRDGPEGIYPAGHADEPRLCFTLLSDPVRRKIYDDEIDAAKDAASRAKAKKRFRAATWNTEMPDMQERLRSQKKEEPTTSRGVMAFVLLFVAQPVVPVRVRPARFELSPRKQAVRYGVRVP